MKHRRYVSALMVAGAVIALAGCAGGSGDGAASEGTGGAGTVNLGVIAPMSGNFAQVGEHLSKGFELGVQHAQADGLAADVAFEIEVKDDQADAQAASQAARDFMSDGTMLVSGMLTTTTCAAVAPLVDQAGGVLVSSVCAGNDLSGVYTGEAPFPRTFTVAARDSMVAAALAQVLSVEAPDVVDYNVFGFDYAWGRDTWAEYNEVMGENGVDINVNQELWVPLGDTNYRSQVSAMSNRLGDADDSAIFLSTFGAGTTAFLQQAEAFDIANRVALLANAGGYEPVARSLAGSAPQMWNAYDYAYPAFDSDQNTRFVDEYLQANDERPMAWSYHGYLSGYAYVAAVDSAGSGDPDAVLEALGEISFEGPSGELRFDPETHQLLVPVVVTKSVGNPDAPEGIEYLETVVVPAEDLVE